MTFLGDDQVRTDFRPVDELGQTGLKRHGGFVFEEFLKDLQGVRGVRTYREMADNDPTIGALLFTFDKLVRRVEWRVDLPDEADGTSKEARDFVEGCMADMSHSWADFISEAMSMLVYGWSFFEIVYKRRSGDSKDGSRRSRFTDGKVGWRKFSIRSQDSLLRWEFSEDGGLVGAWFLSPPVSEPVFIPIEKALLFRTQTYKNNPEGRSILRNAYRPWYFKKRIEEIEAVGVERDLAGFPVMTVDPAIMEANAPPEKRAAYLAYQDIVRNIRRDAQEGLILPAIYDTNGNLLYSLNLLSSGGSRQFDTTGIIERYDRRILMSVLADFIMLGQSSVGSFALSSDKTELFVFALTAVLDVIKETLNTHAVPRLLRLNGMSVEHVPQFSYGDVEDVPLSELASYIQTLSGAGMPFFPNQRIEDYLYERANIPKPTPEEREAMEQARQEQQMAMAPPAEEGPTDLPEE